MGWGRIWVERGRLLPWWYMNPVIETSNTRGGEGGTDMFDDNESLWWLIGRSGWLKPKVYEELPKKMSVTARVLRYCWPLPSVRADCAINWRAPGSRALLSSFTTIFRYFEFLVLFHSLEWVRLIFGAQKFSLQTTLIFVSDVTGGRSGVSESIAL